MEIQDYISKNNLRENLVGFICLTICLYDKTLNGKQKIELLLQLFDQNPECGILTNLMIYNYEMTISERNIMWDYFRKQLSKGDSLQRKHIERSLCLGFFEDSGIVHEAWGKLIGDYQNVNILKILLTISSPVPFDLKDDLYQKVIKHQEYHKYIFESLEKSFFNVYGNINIKRARTILSSLKIDKTTKKYLQLENNLKKFSSKAKYLDSLNYELGSILLEEKPGICHLLSEDIDTDSHTKCDWDSFYKQVEDETGEDFHELENNDDDLDWS